MSMSTAYTEAWLPGPQETRFYTRTYTAERPTAVLIFVHGAAEHAGRYTDMHKAVAEQNISVFVFDLRGYGRTALDKQNKSKNSAYGKTNGETQLDDLEWVIEYVQSKLEDVPIFIMGASMASDRIASLGGGIVLRLMCDEKRATHKAVTAVRGVIAGSPFLTIAKDIPKAVMWLGKSVAVVNPYMVYPVRNKPEDLSRNAVTNAEYVMDPFIKTPGSLKSILDMMDTGVHLLSTAYVNWPQDVPLLFLHGSADLLASFESSKTLFAKLPAKDKNMIIYQGAYHELHNEPDGVREKSLADVVEFIQSHAHK
ncbi:Alpha/Beta hydrolase protein [Mycena metata]|uniref:Alpha/Beta hydrolase protein n=1 Tax=Mycena metata TaxID=1033252 RepID=A0AAD7MDQ0_9AGAR|nr:Alpha/Beta hydrolase protein [Mycena metata]